MKNLQQLLALKGIRLLLSLIASFLVGTPSVAQNEVSGVYVGGHIRRERPNTIATLRNSGFTYVLLFNVDVKEDGTLATDGETICKDGEYVFTKTQPYYQQDVKNLKTAPTSISRIDIVIGGWGNHSYTNIKKLIASGGTSENSILYRNFKALKEAVPEIDGVNNDDEECYDVNSAASFHIMMANLGYQTTLAPYTRKDYWQSLCTKIRMKKIRAVDRIMVQCYEGGAWNNPADWNFTGVTNRHGGRMNYQSDMETSIKQMETWKKDKAANGGFVWVYNDETWNLNAWASAMNRTFEARKTAESDVAVKCYSENNYGGYCVSLPEGTYTQADLAVYGLAANDLSSLEIKEGYFIKLYRTDNARGTFIKRNTSQPKLSSAYNNQVKSLIIQAVEDGVEGVADEEKPERTKYLENGKLYILKDGVKYSTAGVRLE